MSSSIVNDMLRQLKTFCDDDYRAFLCQSLDINRPPEVNRAVVKKVMKDGQRNSKLKPIAAASGTSSRGNAMEQPLPSIQQSAWKTPVICRGDLAPFGCVLAIDVEKVTLKKENNYEKHATVAETIAVVNENNELVFWCFVKYPESEVCQLFSQLTGLSREKLSIGIPIEEVRQLLLAVIRGTTVVGYDLENDLKSIGITYEQTEDLSTYFSEKVPPVWQGAKEQHIKYSLKDVAGALFPGKAFQCKVHSAVSDARMTMDCWKKKKELLKSNPGDVICPVTIERTKRTAFIYDRNDACTCPGSGKKSRF